MSFLKPISCRALFFRSCFSGSKKNHWIAFALGVGLAFGGQTCLAQERPIDPQNEFLENCIFKSQKLTLSQVQGWLQEFPEICWLASSDVQVTQEGVSVDERNWSEQIYEKKFIEFDRTIMNLNSLRMILDGSESAYQQFVAAQSKNRLNREQFSKLHEMGMQLINHHPSLSPEEVEQTLKVGVVLGDIGKSASARERFEPYGINEADHDDFLRMALLALQEHPEICSSFEKLPSAARDLLVFSEFDIHIGHVNHIEGGEELFTAFKKQWDDDSAPLKEYRFKFFQFLHICDVAAAKGHVNRDSSLVLTSDTFRTLEASFEVCKELALGQSEREAYETLLKKRAEWLGLNPKDPLDRLITRFASMLRIVGPEKIEILREAFLALPYATRQNAFYFFDPLVHRFLRTNTYVPAVFLNLAANPDLGKSSDEKLAAALQLGLPLVVRVFKKHQQMLKNEQIKPEVRLNFNGVARHAKGKKTSQFSKCEISIDPDGMICLDI